MHQRAQEISIEKVAEIIKSMSPEEIETLSLLLSPEGEELLRRKRDFESHRVRFLSSEEIFEDV